MSFLEVTAQLADGFLMTLLIFGVTLVGAIPLGLLIMFGSTSRFQPVKWLFRVLKNNAISEYRAQCRHAAAPLEESILRAAEPELIPFSGMLPKGLSASEQRILTLRLAEDMDYSTISQKLGISETACRSQYSRARRHCAELMERSDDNAGF